MSSNSLSNQSTPTSNNQMEMDSEIQYTIFNIQGTIFKIRKIDLYFSSFNVDVSNFWRENEDSHYFINRDPLYYNLIFDYVTSEDPYVFDVLSDDEMEVVLRELEYWYIPLKLQWYIPENNMVASFFNDYASVRIMFLPFRYGCVRSVLPLYKYSLKVEKSSNLFIGFLENKNDFKQAITFDKLKKLNVYTLYCEGSMRGIHRGMSSTWNSDAAKIQDGDYLNVVKEGNTIRFIKNGYNLGVAWSNVPEGPLYAFICNGYGHGNLCHIIDEFHSDVMTFPSISSHDVFS